jgi:hypothetical protein
MAANGKLPASDLAPIHQGQLAKANGCAASWNAMNVEARRLGVELRPTGPRSSYRTYQQQVDLYNDYLAGRGALAAKPGTSNHGLGLAVDVATQQMRTVIDRIGRQYGWAKSWSDAPSEWWHLKHRAGVWSGADPGPAGAGAPAPSPEQPPTPQEVEMICTGTADDGTLHVFAAGPGRQAVWLTFQKPNQNTWAGGQAGKQTAKFIRFADVPKGRTIRGLACERNRGGALHLFVTLDDASTIYTWQRKGETTWQGSTKDRMAGLLAFAPKI